MLEPLPLATLAALTGAGGLAARHYLRHRLDSPEDRYMALYGRDAWEGSNMDLVLAFDPAADRRVKDHFRAALAARLDARGPGAEVLWEEADADSAALRRLDAVDLDRLSSPRRGIWLDLDHPGRIRVVWNHMQTDGVGVWNALRPLFDPNPPLLGFERAAAPPPFLPELLALPRVARRLTWRGSLGDQATAALARGFATWSAAPLRAEKQRLGLPFNLLTTAACARAVFDRHPDVGHLNVGVTVFFPFLAARNRYGVLTARVARADLGGIASQILHHVRYPLVSWGVSSAQSYALNRVPDGTFLRLMGYFRRQIDVLVSNLPVGTEPIRVAGVDVDLLCHPWELTLPYYFLLMGTKADLHVSWTSRFEEDGTFAQWPGGRPSRLVPAPDEARR